MAIRAVLFDWGGTIVRDDSLVFGAPASRESVPPFWAARLWEM